MGLFKKITLFGILALLYGCTIEHAEEQILETHVNGVKKTSIWVYPDGKILKRNEWYDNHVKELEIPYVDNVPHGEFKRWTVLGDVSLVGKYKKGKRDGEWISYYVERLNSHKKESVRYYKDDHAIGDWTGWHYNGVKAFEEHYSENGDSIGVWKKWDENGTLIEENSCFNSNEKGYIKKFARSCRILEYYECYLGNRDGSYKLYYESFDAPDSTGASCNTAKIREEGFLDIQSPFPEKFYRADGSILKKIEYKGCNDCDISLRAHDQWFDEQGKLMRESLYKDQNPNGYTGVSYGLCEGSSNLFCAETSHVREYSPSGSMDSSSLSQKDAFSQSIGKYKASVRYIKPGHQLLYEEYWDYVSDASFGDPRIQESRSFYPDSIGGKMASEGFWKFNLVKGSLRHGVWRNWYPSGILKDSLNYVNGERVGDQFSYDSTGKLTIHKTENGKNRPVIMHLEK